MAVAAELEHQDRWTDEERPAEQRHPRFRERDCLNLTARLGGDGRVQCGPSQQDVAQQPGSVDRVARDIPGRHRHQGERDVADEHRDQPGDDEPMCGDTEGPREEEPQGDAEQHKVHERIGERNDALGPADRRVSCDRRNQERPSRDAEARGNDQCVDQVDPARPAVETTDQAQCPGAEHRVAGDVDDVGRRWERGLPGEVVGKEQ